MQVRFTLFPGSPSGRGGAYLNSIFFDPDIARSMLIAAEEAGFQGAVVDDPAGLLGNLELASYTATQTDALTVVLTHWAGVMSPPAAAQQIASINDFAAGRLAVRIPLEELSGQPEGATESAHPARQHMADEYLMLLKRLWASDRPFDYEGPFYSVRNGHVVKRGRVGGGPQVRMAGRSGAALAVAGRHADIFELEVGSLLDIRTMMRRVQTAATPFGRAGRISFALPVTALCEGMVADLSVHPACTVRLDNPSKAALALLPYIEAGIGEFMVSGLRDAAAIEWFGEQIIPLVRNSALHLRRDTNIPDAPRGAPLPRRSATMRWRGLG